MQAAKRFSLGIFLMCLGMAFALWLYVSMSSEFSIRIDVPLSITLPDDKAFETAPPRTISTKVRGVGWQLISLQFSHSPNVALAIEREQLRLQGNNIRISKAQLLQHLLLPPSIEATDILPDSLQLIIGTIASKKVPIKPNVEIMLPDGFAVVGAPSAKPESVVVRGNTKILPSIKEISTIPIALNGVYRPISIESKLSDSLDALVQTNETKVRIDVNISQSAEINFDHIPITVTQQSFSQNDSIIALPSFVSVTVRGSINTLAKLKSEDITVKVNPYQSIRYENSKNSFKNTQVSQRQVAQRIKGNEVFINSDEFSYAKPEISVPNNVEVLSYYPSSIRILRRIKRNTFIQ